MSRKPVTAPLDEGLLDEVAAGKYDPEIVSFVKRFLRFAEEDRRNARGLGPVPKHCAPLVSSRPKDEVLSDISDLEVRYSHAYYERYLLQEGSSMVP